CCPHLSDQLLPRTQIAQEPTHSKHRDAPQLSIQERRNQKSTQNPARHVLLPNKRLARLLVAQPTLQPCPPRSLNALAQRQPLPRSSKQRAPLRRRIICLRKRSRRRSRATESAPPNSSSVSSSVTRARPCARQLSPSRSASTEHRAKSGDHE